MTIEEYNNLKIGDYVKMASDQNWTHHHQAFTGQIVRISDFSRPSGIKIAVKNKLFVNFTHNAIERISSKEEYEAQFQKSKLEDWTEF